MNNQYDVRESQLRGYLRQFYCKPDLNPTLWSVAKACLDNKKTSFYGVRFADDLSMNQFVIAVLLSSGKQFNWYSAKSFSVVQDNIDSIMLLSEYENYDIVFVVHSRGTMSNKIMGASINQMALLRAPKKTFFFDRGGYPLSDLIVPVVSVYDLMGFASKAIFSNGDSI